MKFHILNRQDDIIASFEHEADREICLDAFEEEYYDEDFSTKENE